MSVNDFPKRDTSEARFFIPYQGPKYTLGLINNKKILVVGASHYCTYSKKSINYNEGDFECPVWAECTSPLKKCSSKFDKICPHYTSIGWYKDYDYISLSNRARIEIENYLEGANYPAYNRFTKFMLDYLGWEEKEQLWNRIAFVNYVQYFLPQHNTPTLDKTDINSFIAFLSYCEELKPDIVIVWGVKIINHFKQSYVKSLVESLVIDTNDSYIWYLKHNSLECKIVNTYHPASRDWWGGRNGFKEALDKVL